MVDRGGQLSRYRNVNSFWVTNATLDGIRWNQRLELRKYRIPNDYWVASRQAGHQFESHTEEYRLYGVKQLEIFSRFATRRIRVGLANSLQLKESLIIQRDPNGISHRVNWRFCSGPQSELFTRLEIAASLTH